MSDLVIDTQGLRKWFGPTLAVADLSLSVRAGEIFGFLGPNGAGKTTSIKMLLSLVHPDGGDGRVLGRPLGDRLSRARVGFLPEHFRFHDCLTARELLGRRSYKSDDVARQTPDRLIARKDLVDALEQGRSRLGLRLKLTAAQRDALAADGSGDSIDAVLCLLQAAWAQQQPDWGLPAGVDRLEGWIVGA